MVESVNTDELVQAIADAVLKRLEPIFSNTANGAAQQVKSRRDMAEHIGCSESTLDRMRADGMPSLMVGNNRVFVVEEVLAWMREQTPRAEAEAIERQAAKQSAKRSAKAERQSRSSAKELRVGR